MARFVNSLFKAITKLIAFRLEEKQSGLTVVLSPLPLGAATYGAGVGRLPTVGQLSHHWKVEWSITTYRLVVHRNKLVFVRIKGISLLVLQFIRETESG